MLFSASGSDALIDHRICNLAEACDVRAENVVVRLTEFFSCGACSIVDADHDAVELLVDFFAGPAETHCVLAHFESAGGYAAGIGSLAGGEEKSGALDDLGRFERGRHVRAFRNAHAAVLDQSFGVFDVS